MDELRRGMAAFVVSAVAGVGFVVAYWVDASDRWMGGALAGALLAFGVGLVLTSRALDGGDVTEARPQLAAGDDEHAELEERLRRPAPLLRRRGALAVMAGSVAVLGAAVVVPLRSLGRRPDGIGSTPWRDGRRLVLSDGTPVAASTLGADGLLTAYPEDALDDGNGAVVVVRLPASRLSSRTVDGGAVDGIVAYSKICTHAGCAVGLFQADDRDPHRVHRLLCPCHQSAFDPFDGARPVAGPAPRSLPQLPLAVDADGNLVATAAFDRPVGPASWTWP